MMARFVGEGQPSLLHLAKHIQTGMQPKLKQAAQAISLEYETADEARHKELQTRLDNLNAIDSELIITRYLQPCRNPELHDPTIFLVISAIIELVTTTLSLDESLDAFF